MRRRKFRIGSMQLSIEAIIILVIAIVLLGLGIAFIKNFFGQGTVKLTDQLGQLESCSSNADYPIQPTKFTVRAGESATDAKLCIYNGEKSTVVNGVIIVKECIKPGTSTPIAGGPIKVSSLRFTLDRAKAGNIPFTIDATAATDLGTYICSLQVSKPTPTPTDPVIGPIQLTFVVT